MFTVDAAGFDYQTAVIWAGRNNAGDPATVLADIAAMVGFLKPVNKRFVVISVLNGNYPGESIGGDGYDKIVNQINAKLRERYPNNYLDVREMLIRNYNSAQSGDVTDANNDVPPRSLRSDEVHLNEAGKALVAQTVKNFFTQNNW
jgi:lysophospholipase L1-like esterase